MNQTWNCVEREIKNGNLFFRRVREIIFGEIYHENSDLREKKSIDGKLKYGDRVKFECEDAGTPYMMDGYFVSSSKTVTLQPEELITTVLNSEAELRRFAHLNKLGTKDDSIFNVVIQSYKFIAQKFEEQKFDNTENSSFENLTKKKSQVEEEIEINHIDTIERTEFHPQPKKDDVSQCQVKIEFDEHTLTDIEIIEESSTLGRFTERNIEEPSANTHNLWDDFFIGANETEIQRRSGIPETNKSDLPQNSKIVPKLTKYDGQNPETVPKYNKYDGVPCKVCGDVSTGLHYGVFTCEGCKGFFRRTLKKATEYRICAKGQQCMMSMSPKTRTQCPDCRFNKCLLVGMSRAHMDESKCRYQKRKTDYLTNAFSLNLNASPGASPQKRLNLGPESNFDAALKVENLSADVNPPTATSLETNSTPLGNYQPEKPSGLLQQILSGQVILDNLRMPTQSETPNQSNISSS